MNLEQLYTLDEVAEVLAVTRRSVYNYLKDGKLKGQKVGKYWRFTETNIQDFLDLCTAQAHQRGGTDSPNA